MDSPKQWTADQVVMLAAASLPQPFIVWDLVVEAWRLWPERFGIPGHEHPNATRVLIVLMNTKPQSPTGRQWVEKVAENTYRLTPEGWDEVERIRKTTLAPMVTARKPSAAEVKVKELTAEVGKLRLLLIRIRIAISTVRTAEAEREGLNMLMHDIRSALGEKEYGKF
jgi:hypothetical protein